MLTGDPESVIIADMRTKPRIKDPNAQPTERQIELLRHLLPQFYPDHDPDQIIALKCPTKGTASDAIDKLIAAGGRKPTPPRKASTSGRPGKATDRQVTYALTLLRRVNWHDSDWGQDGSSAPTEAELRRMSRQDISALIEDLRRC